MDAIFLDELFLVAIFLDEFSMDEFVLAFRHSGCSIWHNHMAMLADIPERISHAIAYIVVGAIWPTMLANVLCTAYLALENKILSFVWRDSIASICGHDSIIARIWWVLQLKIALQPGWFVGTFYTMHHISMFLAIPLVNAYKVVAQFVHSFW